jgi:hypothetical protein
MLLMAWRNFRRCCSRTVCTPVRRHAFQFASRELISIPADVRHGSPCRPDQDSESDAGGAIGCGNGGRQLERRIPRDGLRRNDADPVHEEPDVVPFDQVDRGSGKTRVRPGVQSREQIVVNAQVPSPNSQETLELGSWHTYPLTAAELRWLGPEVSTTLDPNSVRDRSCHTTPCLVTATQGTSPTCRAM